MSFNSQHPIILASGSSIRAQILTDAGLEFSVLSKPVDEDAIKTALLAENVAMSDIADALAEAKALKVSRTEAGFVIGADQIMVMKNASNQEQLFDKPKTMAEAKDRLWAMRGKPHHLIGAVVIAQDGAVIWRHISKTTLYVREFSQKFLDDYLIHEGEDILHCVGAYKFEGRGAQLFSRVEGDFFSILGLSLLPVLEYLRLRGAVST